MQESRNASLTSFPAFLIYKPWNEKLLMRRIGNQECFAYIFSYLPAFLIFKPWNEALLMRNAGNQECFAPLFSCLPAFLILKI
jgi:hypothetical protein